MKESKEIVYKKISNIFGDVPFIFIKFFGEREYAQDFSSGKLYCNTPKYYQELENNTKIKGQGDKNEGVAEVSGMKKLVFKNRETNEPLLYCDSDNIEDVVLRLDIDKNNTVPMCCFMWFKVSDFYVDRIEGNHIIFKINKMDCIEKTVNDCGDFFVAFLPEHFECAFNKFIKNSPLIKDPDNNLFSKVIYSDSLICKTIALSELKGLGVYKYKEKFFEYQREFRIVANMSIPSDNIIDLGPCSVKSAIYNNKDIIQLSKDIYDMEICIFMAD
ncbi:hypothetical protein [Peptostreptococcus sp.]